MQMQIQILKSKIHRVRVTQAELDYIGSITIDETLMLAANIIEGERVQIVNVNNGERFETYVIKGEPNSGNICLNGPAARRVAINDIIIILGYGIMDFEEAKLFKPALVFPNEKTNLLTS
jgi:aspartate 1-decarboxylase